MSSLLELARGRVSVVNPNGDSKTGTGTRMGEGDWQRGSGGGDDRQLLEFQQGVPFEWKQKCKTVSGQQGEWFGLKQRCRMVEGW